MPPLLYNALKMVAKVLLSLLCQREIKIKKNAIPQGPLIIVANHISWFDPPLLGISLPRRIAFMAKKELFHPPFGFFLHHLGGFPVRRGEPDRRAIQKAEELLKDGWALGMFPEGKRSGNAQLQRAYPGVALIALHSNATILPVGIAGTEKIKQRVASVSNLFHRPKVIVNIGKPFKLPPLGKRMSHEHLVNSTNLIMRRIAELLPENYRGAYREEKGED